jgi:tripartite ATP-independent transporter DctM subunit
LLPHLLLTAKGANPLTGYVGIFALLFLMVVMQIPVGFAMAIVGFCGLWYMTSLEAALTVVSTETWVQFSSYGMSVLIPFILLGFICFHSEVNQNLYRTVHTWFGRTRGGIAMATVLACGGFAAICGSNSATAATMTTVALPEMKKYHYNAALSSGAIACGSTLGVVIPPSLVLLVYGLQTGTSIGKLFWGSLVPGLVLIILFALTIYMICLRRPEMGPAGSRTNLAEKVKALPGAIEMIVLFGLVMGGLYSGTYTPTEAGSASAFFAFLIAVTIRRKLSLSGFYQAILDTLRISSMVIMIVLGAVIFGRFLTLSRLPFVLLDMISGLHVPGYVVLVFVFAVYIIAGAFMDAMGFLLVSIPIFVPIAVSLGYDLIWFGCTITVITTLGAITPPVGICAYVVGGMDKTIQLSTVFRGALWFFPAYVITVVLMVLFPDIVLFIPNRMGG